MIRTALQPRWLGLLALLLVVLYTFGRLGLWQLQVAGDIADEELLAEQTSAPAVPLAELTDPFSAFPDDGSGRAVTVEGSYAADRQFLVPHRVLDGESGYWVMTPVRTEQGALVTVLRGWVAEPGRAGSPPPTPVTVTGTLAPGESPALYPSLPPGQLGSVDLAALANTWPEDLFNAFVFATDETPQLTSSEVVPVPPPALTGRGFDWGNLGYALQWWVFCGFAVYMYVRFLKEASAAPHTVPS